MEQSGSLAIKEASETCLPTSEWGSFPKRLQIATGAFCLHGDCMRQEFREGDWVRHRSSSVPIRVVGIGSTIAVRSSTGAMQAFEPCELERAQTTKRHVLKVQVYESAELFVLVSFVSLLYLTMLAWCSIAGVGR